MTYEEALQIAIEELYDAVDYCRAMNKGFPKVERQCNRLMEAHDLLRKELENADKKREWVGLTQEELQDLCVKSYHTDNAGETHFGRGYFADAIEAKLKEKNT